MFVVFIEADEDSKNCSLFNCEYPAKAINKVPGHKAEVYTITEFNQHTERVNYCRKKSFWRYFADNDVV